MASPTFIAIDQITTNGGSTSSLPAGASGSRRVLLMSGAQDSPTAPTTVSVSGGGVSWSIVNLSARDYRVRRKLWILVSDGPCSSGTLSITLTITTVFREILVASVDINDWVSFSTDAFTAISSPGVSALSVSSGAGSIGTNDYILFVAGAEDASQYLDVDGDSVRLGRFLTGTDCRSLVAGYTTTDVSPGVIWDSVGDDGECGIVGIYVTTSGVTESPIYIDTPLKTFNNVFKLINFSSIRL